MRDVGVTVQSRLTGPVDEQELVAQISATLLDTAPDVMPLLLHRLQQAKNKFRRKGLGKLPTEDVETWTAELANGIEILSRLAPPLNRLVSNNPAIITAQSGTPSLQSRCIADRDLFFNHQTDIRTNFMTITLTNQPSIDDATAHFVTLETYHQLDKSLAAHQPDTVR